MRTRLADPSYEPTDEELSELSRAAFSDVAEADNSVDDHEARLVVRFRDGKLRKAYGQAPDWVTTAMVGLPRHPDFEQA